MSEPLVVIGNGMAAARLCDELSSRALGRYAVAVVGMATISAISIGPIGAFIPELFATRYRYSGSALAVNLAGVVAGALPPLIAGTLLATYGTWAIGVMLAVLMSTSLVCTYLLPETKGTTLGAGLGEAAR